MWRSFKYVYIPCDIGEPLQELELVIPPEKEVECLLTKLQEHFSKHGQKTAEQREKQKADLRAGAGTGHVPADLEALLNTATDMTMAENVCLLPNNPSTDYVGVNMYVDDSGAIKQLPLNLRASEIAACCGHPVQVHGDAFLARVKDNDDEFERLDFTLSEVSSSAAWVKKAAELAEQRRRSDGAARLMAELQGRPGGSAVRELTAAEAAKEEGNQAFKRGEYGEAEACYSRALDLDMSMVSAANNRAQCRILTGDWGGAEEDCSRVLGVEPRNVKALLRRATARQRLSRTEEALTDTDVVLAVQPNNKEAKELRQQLQAALGR